MSLELELQSLVACLPPLDRTGRRTVREACVTLNEDGSWSVLAGGHYAVHIGEWGGDFDGDGGSITEAIAACRTSIANSRK